MAATGDRRTESGIEVKPVYTAADAPRELEPPGEYPYTRGPYPDMYRGRPWTIRQYAGFASAEESNARYRYLLERGQTGLSIAFDLPTQLGYDSDDPRAVGEVGRTGVAIDSIADMEILLAGIPLGEVSTSMTINAPASLLLLLYELVAEGQGVAPDALRGTVQNDILKEYIARGNYIFPPRPSMRLTTDLFAYCAERIPRWNTISISGYHIREAGSTAVQELAFTLANGIAYCEAAVEAGLSPDDFGARLSFFFNAHNDFFQEVAKFRAARRLWARIMRERFGATNPRALALRFHAQTGGSTLTAQQPENNIVRVAIQALSAVAGGAQSLHTNSYDEALALPSEHAAHIALRTQQVIAAEAGTIDTADPLGGSYYVEALTDELEARAWELIERVDEAGGAVAAVESGFVQEEIERAAFEFQQQVEAGERVIVGVNAYEEESGERIELLQIDPAAERRQLERTAQVRAERNAEDGGRGDRGGARGCSRRREPASADARGAARALHGRRDLRGAARGVGDVRRGAGAGLNRFGPQQALVTRTPKGGSQHDKASLDASRRQPDRSTGAARRNGGCARRFETSVECASPPTRVRDHDGEHGHRGPARKPERALDQPGGRRPTAWPATTTGSRIRVSPTTSPQRPGRERVSRTTTTSRSTSRTSSTSSRVTTSRGRATCRVYSLCATKFDHACGNQLYERKHNPFVSFADVQSSPAPAGEARRSQPVQHRPRVEPRARLLLDQPGSVQRHARRGRRRPGGSVRLLERAALIQRRRHVPREHRRRDHVLEGLGPELGHLHHLGRERLHRVTDRLRLRRHAGLL